MSNDQKISIKIDLNKIVEEHLYLGSPGKRYLDATLIPGVGKFGDSHYIMQSVSKEKRETGVKGVTIGYGKVLGAYTPKPSAQPATKTTTIYNEQAPPF